MIKCVENVVNMNTELSRILFALLAIAGGLSSAAADVSLNGSWRFRGLEVSSVPFPSLTEAERSLLGTDCDDGAWAEIRVPLNWWRDNRFAYHRYGAKDRYFRGYYRRHLTLDRPWTGRRLLRFEEIGAEADLFVNGRFAGRHLGDFTPFEADVTDFLREGDNVIALRVLADFGPDRSKGEKYVRVYGAHWDRTVVKGGIWHDVKLIETATQRLTRLLVDPGDDLESATVRCRVENPALPLTVVAEVEVRSVRDGRTVGAARLDRPVRLERGATDFEVKVACPGVERWSPENPALYVATVRLCEAERVVSESSARFGFRTMRLVDGEFRLNGERLALIGDSVHSCSYGGFGGSAVEPIRECLLAQKRNGIRILRTAHMPSVPELYELADELGMMIYDEWGCSFCSRMDVAAFERNNLPEVERWVLRDYNHPCVVLWSLGNEVKFRNDEEAIARQLDLQYALVRRLDRQNRPACAFSGVADLEMYGRRRLKTDFLDLHSYHGIDGVPWSHWFERTDVRYFGPLAEVYGENGRLSMPVVMWECVGGGWGIVNDPSVKPGCVDAWLDWMNRSPGAWDQVQNNSICFSPATGLYPLLDPARGVHYLQGILGHRLCELFRQDGRLAGFAPWFVDPKIPGQDLWNQPVYPLLRRGGGRGERLMFRQWTSPGEKALECLVVNSTPRTLTDVRLRLAFAGSDGRCVDLGTERLERVEPFERRAQPFVLRLPGGLSPSGEIRLDLSAAAGVSARNAYPVTVHGRESLVRPVSGKVFLTASDAACERVLRDLKLDFAVVDDASSLPGGTLVVPPGRVPANDAALRAFVRRGGTLAVLEPPTGPLAGFGERLVKPRPNPLVEPVMTGHPAFKGLVPADFDIWAERPYGDVISSGVMDTDRGVLAGLWGTAAVAEYGFGKGRVFVSTPAACGLWGKNPAATRYLNNLFAYLVRPTERPGLTLADPSERSAPAEGPRPIVMKGLPRTVDFAASAEEHRPAKIFFFGDEAARLSAEGFRYFTLTLAAATRGRLAVTIPEKSHRNRLECVVPLLGDGRVRTWRLDLKKDFSFARAGTFSLADVRGEIILYNGGVERTRGVRRDPVSFKILEAKFE